MKDNDFFKAENLKSYIVNMADRFNTPEDFTNLTREEEVANLLDKCLNVPNLQDKAYILTGREMENILLALFSAEKYGFDSKVSKVLIDILNKRINHRLIKIIWQLYQLKYEEKNDNINEVLKVVYDFNNIEGKNTDEGEILSKFYESSGFEHILKLMNGFELPVNSFRKAYHLNKKNPLLWEAFKRFFEQCEKDRYKYNEAWTIRIIEANETSDLTKLITNYLDKLNEEEFIDEINLKLLNKMGYPYSSDEWKNIGDEYKKKFSNWNSSRLLANHFKGKSNKKYKLLNKYLKDIKEIFPMKEGKLLIIDFNDFIILDDLDIEYYSYLINKERFEQIKEGLEYESIKVFMNREEKPPEARDYIIEESESSILQLNYREVGKLYIKKTLDIMLGNELDMRASKSILKKVKVSFKDNII